MKFKIGDVLRVKDRSSYLWNGGRPILVSEKCKTQGQWIDDNTVCLGWLEEYPFYADFLGYYEATERKSKFKVGDKVISTKNTANTQEGFIGVITDIDDYEFPIRVVNSNDYSELFTEEELELLESKEPVPIEEIEEHTGSSVNYYKVYVANPTTLDQPYYAEANDIIESLGLTFAEGNLLKAVWRIAADRNGKKKKGNNSVYDAEKLVFFANRVLVQEKGE